MYLSQLLVDALSRRGQAVLTDFYKAHQLVMLGFPPAPRGGPGRVLFRVEPEVGRESGTILVQSDHEPDWRSRVHEGVLLRASSKRLELPLENGLALRFRLRANPTIKRDGRRLGLVGEAGLHEWLSRKAEGSGFRIGGAAAPHLPVPLVIPEGTLVGRAPGRPPIACSAARFEGVLKVTNSRKLLESIRVGIGSAKAFGFGLLSVAPGPTRS